MEGPKRCSVIIFPLHFTEKEQKVRLTQAPPAVRLEVEPTKDSQPTFLGGHCEAGIWLSRSAHDS